MASTLIIYRQKFREAFGVESIYDNPLLLALAYSMDAAGFTEHGSSIGGAWLTPEGEMFLLVLQNNNEVTNEVTKEECEVAK